MSRKDIKNKILGHMQAAAHQAEEANALRSAGALSLDGLAEFLRSYILAKYRLDETEARGVDDLERLAEISLEKMKREFPEIAAEETRSATCDAASSVDNKQALLMMAIQKDFEVEFNGFDVAFAGTVEDLAAIMWRYYETGKAADPLESIRGTRGGSSR